MKTIKTFIPLYFYTFILFTLCSCSNEVQQVSIPRIEQMQDIPQPYKIIDWKQKALDYDNLVFNFDSVCPAGTFIWLDNNRRNIDQVTFGLFTAVHDARQGQNVNNGEFHEAINSMAAIIGAGLVGIDKTSQNGYNFVKMTQNYYNCDNKWNIVMNNTNPNVALLGGGYGRDWWYDVLPNVLFYMMSDIFPNVDNADFIQRNVAEQFYKADSVLNGNYDYSYFDYGNMRGGRSHIPFQQDAAGGHGYVLYSAYQKFGDAKYLEGAISAIAALDNQKESRFYEILLPIGCYTAARLNAEQGTKFDIEKMLNWVFEGCTNMDGRYGWGVVCGRWGDYDVSGLQGSILDGEGYAFFMNSMKMAIPLVPLVKYQPQYARAIGRWMLNNVNSARLFFPYEIDDQHQFLPEMKDIANGVIAYEGLRQIDIYGKKDLQGVTPVALGDGPNWNVLNPPESMFSLYSTSPVGVLAAIVDTTDVQAILRLNCNATDFYAKKDCPVYLYYNPYKENKEVTYYSEGNVDLYDAVSGTYLAKNIEKSVKITIPADGVVLLYEKKH